MLSSSALRPLAGARGPARPLCAPRAALPTPRVAAGLRCYASAAAAAAVAPAVAAGSNGNGNGVAAHTPAPAVAAAPVPAVLPPPAAYENVVKMGAAKADMPAWKTFALGILAGCYISFGGFMAMTVAGMMPSLGINSPVFSRLVMGALFPFGLLITLVCGAELYTGNTAMVAAAVYEKKASLGGLVKNWFWSYAGNFVGSLLMVALVAGSGLLAASPVPASMAVAKTSLPWMQAFIRGVLCNWLVCSAVWMASATSSLPGKMLAAYLPVMAFITMGLEHSVANMFFIAMGMANGAAVSWGAFIGSNLVPVTLGNTLAGALCMATAYAAAYGSLGKPKPTPAAAATA